MLTYASDYDNGKLHPGKYSLVGAGFGMSETEAQSLGRSLVNKTVSDISKVMLSLPEEDKKKVVVFYLAAGGDPKKLEAAMPAPGTTTTTGLPKWLMPVAIGAGVLLLGGIVFKLVRR